MLADNKDIPASCKLLRPNRFTPVFVLRMNLSNEAIILPLPMSEQSAGGSGLESAADLLDPYEKLISLEIMGNEVSVPEKNRLLRCFQYLIDQYDFIWRFLLER